jgi:hypothetical protein
MAEKRRFALDLFLRHVLRDQQDVVNGRADGLLVCRDDNAGHSLSRGRPLVSEADHRIPVVRDEHAILGRGPS